VALSTQYDSMFRTHAGRVPVAYLRALAQRESGLRPDVVMPGGLSGFDLALWAQKNVPSVLSSAT